MRHVESIAAGWGCTSDVIWTAYTAAPRWRKMKGLATVQLADGPICEAEIHWFEAHSIGRKDFKI
jgi:hypothetical protein